MIGKIRLRASLIISLALLVASCGMALEGAAQMTMAQPEDVGALMFRWALGSGAVLGAALWALLQYHLRKSEELQSRVIAEVVARAIASHDSNAYAHPVASEHNHAPMTAKLDAIEKKLDRLIAEHEFISGRSCLGSSG